MEPAESPPPPALERRLATILSADVAGYSRMMGEDEEGTVETLRGHRAVFESLLRQHHGRIFNTAGDAILAEFPSAVEAVRCATDIQSALQTRNEHLPPNRKMQFRMGINVGDVVVHGTDLLGDGVNVASRIQTVAEPGGICISGSVYDQIQNKLSLQFRALGDQAFKNIGQRIRTFSITQGEAGALPARSRGLPASTRGIATAAIVVLALGAGGYWIYRDREASYLEQGKLAAQLAAEQQSAAALKQAAEEQTRRAAEAQSKADQERIAAEAAKREAELRAQAVGADRQKAQAEKVAAGGPDTKAISQKARANALREAEESLREEGVKGATTRNAVAAVNAPDASAAPPVLHAFDGSYAGEICNFPADTSRRRCWKLDATVQQGTLSGSWERRPLGKTSQLHASVAPDGTLHVSVEGWNAKGDTPMSGAMDGRIAGNRIDATGRWVTGVKLDAHLTRVR